MGMPHPSLVIFGYSEAAMLLRTPAHQAIVGVISIHGANLELKLKSLIGLTCILTTLKPLLSMT